MTEALDADLDDRIAGKCVLVVEDDYVLAREVCNELKNHGANVLGPAPTVHYANLIIGRRRLDGAILDIKLYGEEVYKLAETLTAQGVPIVFATAYQPEQIDERYRRHDVLTKPLDFSRMRRLVANFRPVPPQAAPVAQMSASPITASGNLGRRDLMESSEQWARLLLQAMRHAV